MAADWWYACTIRSGSGVRAASLGVLSLTMWPRNAGSSLSPTSSNAAERGLANWPAMRPTLMTGTPVEYVRTTAICRITLSLSRMASAENASKDSAQSPACSRKALPSATSASWDVSALASPANTRGGTVARCLRAWSSADSSGQVGCWAAGSSRQESGRHVCPGVGGAAGPRSLVMVHHRAAASV